MVAAHSYGTAPVAALPRRRSSGPGWASIVVVATCALGCVALMASNSRGGSVALLGYDPFNSVQTGKSDNDMDGWAADDEEELPAWATEWASAEKKCQPGEQCLGGDTPNMLGQLGKYVMVKTAPHYNTAADRTAGKNCMGLPGWAVEECQRARGLEARMDTSGQKIKEEEPEQDEEKARPMSLASVGRHPAVRRSLGRRRVAIHASQRAIRGPRKA